METAHNLEETIPYVPRFKDSTSVASEQTQRVYGDVALRTGEGKVLLKWPQGSRGIIHYRVGIQR